MPYTDGQELQNEKGDTARYDATANKWTIIPKATPPQPSTMDEAQNQAVDTGRGVYHGLKNAVSGTAGLAGDVAGFFPDSWRDPPEKRAPSSSDVGQALSGYMTRLFNGEPNEPQGTLGNAVKTGSEYGPALLMGGGGSLIGRGVVGAGQKALEIARTLGSRGITNVAAPVVGTEAAGAAFNQDPRARFTGAMLGGRALNPMGGRKAQMAEHLEGLSKTYQTRENAFRADPAVPQKYKEHYNLLDPAERNQWLTTTYNKGTFPGAMQVNPKGTTWKDLDKDNAIAHQIHDNRPIADSVLPLAGALTAGVFGHRHGLSPEMVGPMMGGVGLTGYLGVRGLGKHLPVPTEETVAALLGNSPKKSILSSGIYSNPMRAEKDQ